VTAILVALVIIVVLAVAVAGASVRILREYERGVVFRLGRLIGQKGPGIVLLIPLIDRMVRVDLRSPSTSRPRTSSRATTSRPRSTPSPTTA
jgi:regulator of protease activity HflC (stomatin/prohibitin superfamily)